MQKLKHLLQAQPPFQTAILDSRAQPHPTSQAMKALHGHVMSIEAESRSHFDVASNSHRN